jgi:hypothetical protein
MISEEAVEKIRAELAKGMGLSKCRRCGCMRETLEQLGAILPALEAQKTAELSSQIAGWLQKMEPIRYACLGCTHCYPAVAMNVLLQAFPDRRRARPRAVGLKSVRRRGRPCRASTFHFVKAKVAPSPYPRWRVSS